MRFGPGLILGLAALAGGYYLYKNYVQKPAPVIQPTTNIKKDLEDLASVGNKLVTDLKKESQNIIQSGAKAAENIKKEGENVASTVAKTA